MMVLPCPPKCVLPHLTLIFLPMATFSLLLGISYVGHLLWYIINYDVYLVLKMFLYS